MIPYKDLIYTKNIIYKKKFYINIKRHNLKFYSVPGNAVYQILSHDIKGKILKNKILQMYL